MKVALLSDIHSNYHAFKACFDDAVSQGAERFIFLGDYVSDLAEPRKTLDLVYQIRKSYPTVCLRGNREGYMLDCLGGKAHFAPGSKSGSLLFTYEHLRQQDLAFFQGLKISDTVTLGGVKLEIAHATAADERYYFDTRDGRMAEVFSRMNSPYLLTGHSHKQYIRHHSGRTIINPGSVGIPQGGSRWPQYAVLDVQNGSISCTLRQVRYDLRDAIHAQFASGLVERAGYWAIGIAYDIITGKECVLELLRRVQADADVQDEEAWRRAALDMGMKLTEEEIKELVVCV